jgi:uncharacterized protein YjcR
MGKRAEKESEAIRLYAEGMDIPQIRVALDVSENTLRAWRSRAGSEWDDARSNCRKGYVASMEDVGKRLRRSREVASSLTGQAGLKDQGRMGQVVNELLRSLLFDLSAKVQTEGAFDGEEMAATIDQLKGLALTMQRLETAAARNIKNEQEIRKQALTDAADAVEKTAVQQGMNAEQAAFWRQQVLGVQ